MQQDNKIYPDQQQPQFPQMGQPGQPGQGLYCQLCNQLQQPEYSVVTQYKPNQNLLGLLCWPCICCMTPEAVQGTLLITNSALVPSLQGSHLNKLRIYYSSMP
jgi:hypothetical protein